MISPTKIGRYLKTDENGFILPDVNLAAIDSQWMSLVTFVKNQILQAGEVSSIYIRGSVPRGLAQSGYSDADFLCISEVNLDNLEKDINDQCKTLFPFVRGIELGSINQNQLKHVKPNRTRPYLEMLLKTQSLFLHGIDVCKDILPFRPDIEMVSHVFNLMKEFENIALHSEEDRKWMSRRIVRSGLEITLDRSQNFTRDLYFCFEQFANYYPKKKDIMYAALENCLNGHVDIKSFGELIRFLNDESKRLTL